MNKAQVMGRMEQAKGKIKKVTGTIVGNSAAARKGRAGEIVGKATAGFGDLMKDDLKSGK